MLTKSLYTLKNLNFLFIYFFQNNKSHNELLINLNLKENAIVSLNYLKNT